MAIIKKFRIKSFKNTDPLLEVKNISISLQDDTTYRKLNPQHRFHSRNEEQRIWSEYFMSGLNETLEGYQVSRLEHSLQSASKALRNGENEEMIVAALLHDIGDELAPMNHSEYAAAILKPYVSEKTHWIVKMHGLFQTYYYAHHLGGDRYKRS